jgi:hypothetical protein
VLLLCAALTDKSIAAARQLEKRLRLDLFAKRSLVAHPSRLMYLAEVLLHPDLVCGTEATVLSDPALIDV